jgi:hypothetical protein
MPGFNPLNVQKQNSSSCFLPDNLQPPWFDY